MRFADAAARLIAFVCLALIVVSCKENTDPETAAYWLDRIDRRPERVEALKNLGRIGDKKALPSVLTWFHKEGDWQADAAYTLGQLGDPAVVPQLVAGLDFSSGSGSDARRKSRTNINIVRALAMLHARDAAPSIKKLLASGDDREREAALQALGELGDPANTKTVADAALNDKEPLLRLAAIQALGELGDPKAVPALIQLLFAELPGVSFYEPARFALIQIGAPAVAPLIATLRRENQEVEAVKMPDGSAIVEGAIEAKAGSVLGSMRAAEAASEVAASLTRLYEKAKKARVPAGKPPPPAYFAVIELAYAAGNIGGPKAAGALLPLLKDPDGGLRLAACEALTTVGDHGAVPALLAAAKSGDAAARRAAVEAASRLGQGADLAAYQALAKIGDAALPAPTMAQIVAAGEPRIQAAKECGTTVDCWRKKLEAKEALVRERAAYELGWLEAKGAVADLVKVAADPEAETRMAAVLSLARLGGADPRQLQAIYDEWQAKLEYAGVNQELLRLIARSKNTQRKGK